MIRFVSFRSPTRGSPARSSDPARRRDPSSITATVAPTSARASARRRVAPARDRRCATREKPKNRKIEKTKTNLDRADLEGVRGSSKPYALFPHTTQKPVGRTPSASPGVVARPANPHARAMSSDEEEAPAPAMERDEEARRRRRDDAIGGSAEAREPRARANDGRGTRAKRAIGGEADDARRRRERDGTEAGDRTTTTTTRTMGSR